MQIKNVRILFLIIIFLSSSIFFSFNARGQYNLPWQTPWPSSGITFYSNLTYKGGFAVDGLSSFPNLASYHSLTQSFSPGNIVTIPPTPFTGSIDDMRSGLAFQAGALPTFLHQAGVTAATFPLISSANFAGSYGGNNLFSPIRSIANISITSYSSYNLPYMNNYYPFPYLPYLPSFFPGFQYEFKVTPPISLYPPGYDPGIINPNLNPGLRTKLQIVSPLPDERFVRNEEIVLRAIVIDPVTVSFKWYSDKDGYLGSGSEININNLSLGIHEIEVIFNEQRDNEQKGTISIRIFDDLWELYQSPPSQAEIDRIMNDFNFHWTNGSGEDENWEVYDSFEFDQTSTDPSKIVAIAKLDILRHQQFSKPLPFNDGNTFNTFYEYVKTHINDIYLKLDCGYNSGSGSHVRLTRSFSVWDGRVSGITTGNPDACKTPLPDPVLKKYLYGLQLLIHETRHCDPDDSHHTTCSSWSNPNLITPGGMDETFEGGSGYAWGAIYYMWLYKYGLYDPEFMKQSAKMGAISLLEGRFCSKPTHSNTDVQVILDELIPN